MSKERKHIIWALIFFSALVFGFCVEVALAEREAKYEKIYTAPPDANTTPGGPGWTEAVGRKVKLKGGETISIGVNNEPNEGKKTLYITFTEGVENFNSYINQCLQVTDANGFYSDGNTVDVRQCRGYPWPDNPWAKTYKFEFGPPQPAYEVFQVKNTCPKARLEFKVLVPPANCSKGTSVPIPMQVPGIQKKGTIRIESIMGYRGTDATITIDQIGLWHNVNAVDISYPGEIIPPEVNDPCIPSDPCDPNSPTGTWDIEFIIIDPNTGGSLPQGGWLWSCQQSDRGIWEAEEFELWMTTTTVAGGEYWLVVHDRLRDEWFRFSLEVSPDPRFAINPNPANGAIDVSKNAVLKWKSGLWAKTTGGHDVYFGTDWADVNSATTATAVIFKGNQDANNYDPPGAMTLGQTYYWRIDEVNEDYNSPPGPVPYPPNGRWKGDVWSFTIEGRAKNLYPADGATDVPKNVVLKWMSGAECKYHDVYFGTSESAVEAATTASDEYKTRIGRATGEVQQWDPGDENMQVGKWYFWRIDEVNTITFKGYVWDFTVANWMLVDDFDFYPNPTDLRKVWNDSLGGIGNPTPGGYGEVYVNKDANFAVDGNSMKFEYWNESSPYYSQTRRSYSKAQDWSYAGNGVTLMEINFFGDANNGPDPPTYVTLSDGTVTAQVNYPDFNDCLEGWQHTWNIPLKDFKGVTLLKISSIILGVGDKTKEGGGAKEQGTIYFDDIALRPPRCVLEYGPVGDFTEDCGVDNQDLDIMATDWLLTDSLAITETQNGTLTGFTNNPAQWVTGHIGGALEFDGVDDYVHVTDPRLFGLTSMSITAWVKQPLDNEWVGIVTSLETVEGRVECAELGLYGGYGGPDGLGYDWSWASGEPWKFDAGLDVPLDTWTFAALSVNPNGATLYMRPVGGTLGSKRKVLYHPPLETFKEYFDIGASYPAPDSGGFFKGAMDDVRIYDWDLSFANVSNLAYQIADPNPWPVYWYKFDETTGFTAADSGFGTEVYGPVPSKANLTDPEPQYQRSVNFRDYALLADEWLVEQLWPSW